MIFASLLALLVALAYYYHAAIDIDIFNTGLLDLHPILDGPEYFSGAVSILRYGEFSIRIGDDFLPSRYPFGYSLFLVPFVYFLDGSDIILAPYIANQMIGLIFLLGTFFFFFLQRRFLGAGISVGLLVTLPAFILFSRSSMSENLGSAAILLFFFLLYLAKKRDGFKYTILASSLLGISLSIRLQYALLTPALGIALLLKTRNSSSNILPLKLLLIPLTFAIASLPLLLCNYITVGEPFSTGYDFWVPDSISFSPKFIWPNLQPIWNEFSLSQNPYRVADISGTGVYLTPPFIILSIISILRSLANTNSKELAIISSAISLFSGTLLYSCSDARFFYPLMILSIFSITYLLEEIFNRRNQWNITIKFFVISILLFTLVGFPSAAGNPEKLAFSQTTSLLDETYLGDQSPSYSSIREYIEEYECQAKTLIITDMVIPYVSSLLSEDAVVIPATDNHDFRFSNQWKFGADDCDQYIQRFLSRGDRIIFLSKEKLNTGTAPAFPDVSNRVWKKLPVSTDSLIYELVPVSEP
ncbi:MAG: hypothetical protein F6K42_07130 [Leptolyngbya sp. SIO1D8]|nr:hypothetical protein [Leptolyngbya sp. SIO1D8]